MFNNICAKCGAAIDVPWTETICTQCRIQIVPVKLNTPLTGIKPPTISHFKDFYVYGWIHKDISYPVLWGKGTGTRVTDLHFANKYKQWSFAEEVRQKNKKDFSFEVLRHQMVEQDAFDLEQHHVNEAVAAGHQLLNRMPGGGIATDNPPKLPGDFLEHEVMTALLNVLPQSRSIVDVSETSIAGIAFLESEYLQTLVRGSFLRVCRNYVTFSDVKQAKALYGMSQVVNRY